MKLTKEQIEIVVQLLNPGPSSHISIVERLLTTGECIVAGRGQFWVGGVQNFIKVCDCPQAVECVLLKLDVDTFIYSAWFQSLLANYAYQLHAENMEREAIIGSVNGMLDSREATIKKLHSDHEQCAKGAVTVEEARKLYLQDEQTGATIEKLFHKPLLEAETEVKRLREVFGAICLLAVTTSAAGHEDTLSRIHKMASEARG